MWIFFFTSGREASPCCGQKEHLGPPAGAVKIFLLLSSAGSCECVETPLRPCWDPTETWDITTPRQQRQVKRNVFSLNKCEKFSLIRVMVCSVWSNGGSETRPQHNECSRTFKSISAAAAVFKAPLRRACPSVLLLQPENSTTSSLRRSWKSWWAAGWRPRSCIHAPQTLFPHLYFPVFYRYWSKVKGVHLENPVFAAHGQF